MTPAFHDRDGGLFAEDVDLTALAEAVGTPFFCYSSAAMTDRYKALAAVLDPLGVDILFAVKANSNQAVIATSAAAGAGADVVSEGEIRQALAAGVLARRIVFAGVAKTAAEMAFALEAGIGVTLGGRPASAPESAPSVFAFLPLRPVFTPSATAPFSSVRRVDSFPFPPPPAIDDDR